MSNEADYDWITFYEELTTILLSYKDKRQELNKKMNEISNYLTKAFNYKDIFNGNFDPFTIMGILNTGTDNNKRNLIAEKFSDVFYINQPIPENFDGISTVTTMPKDRTFYNYQGSQKEIDDNINTLWNLFVSALSYAHAGDNQNNENKKNFSKYFEEALQITGDKLTTITKGLSWIAPKTFLSLDGPNVEYIYTSGKIPNEIIKILPKEKEISDAKIDAGQYLDMVTNIKKYLEGKSKTIRSFYELSASAYDYGKKTNNTKYDAEEENSENGKTNIDYNEVQFWVIGTNSIDDWNEFYNDGIIAIGWGELGDLSKFKSQDAIYDALQNIYKKTNPTNNAKGNWQFANNIKQGDIIFAKDGLSKIIGCGITISDYYFDNTRKSHPNVHKVAWISKAEFECKVPMKAVTEIEDKDERVEKLKHFYNIDIDEYCNLIQNLHFESTSNNSGLHEQTKNDTPARRITGGANILYYGVPGAGKSYKIKQEIDDPTRMIRVIFHPDYTYSDFIGQILPKLIKDKDNPDGKLKYEFVPGPFTCILKDAENDPNHKYYLVIEEINRGNAPAIFGDIFQLLDRDTNGNSEYAITNSDIADEVYKKQNENKEENEKINTVKIPSNLMIYATMNTSDQNVFTLDTAFQRRWDMRLVLNDFDDTNDELLGEKIKGTEITWKTFATVINETFLNSTSVISSEDKRLGTHFVNKSELETDKFPHKVLKYLWDDAFRTNRESIFKDTIKSLDDIIIEYDKAVAKEKDPLDAVLKNGNDDVYSTMCKKEGIIKNGDGDDKIQDNSNNNDAQ